MFQDRAQAAAPDLYAYKTADESVTSSTTLQDDDFLFVSVKANRKYVFRLVLFHKGKVAADGIKTALGGTCTLTYLISGVTAGSDVYTSLGDTQNFLYGVDDAINCREIIGSFEPATDGTLVFQWAQVTSNIGAVTVMRGSSLSVWRLV